MENEKQNELIPVTVLYTYSQTGQKNALSRGEDGRQNQSVSILLTPTQLSHHNIVPLRYGECVLKLRELDTESEYETKSLYEIQWVSTIDRKSVEPGIAYSDLSGFSKSHIATERLKFDNPPTSDEIFKIFADNAEAADRVVKNNIELESELARLRAEKNTAERLARQSLVAELERDGKLYYHGVDGKFTKL